MLLDEVLPDEILSEVIAVLSKEGSWKRAPGRDSEFRWDLYSLLYYLCPYKVIFAPRLAQLNPRMDDLEVDSEKFC